MKKALNFIWGLLKNNLLLKIMAVLFAVILWSYVLAETNPLRERVIPDVPVKYSEAELNANGLAISKRSMLELLEVNVHVKVNQNNLDSLDVNSVDISIDLSSISSPGEYILNFETTPNITCQVVEISPETVTLTIEDYVTKTLPVAVNTTGSVASGYYAGEAAAQPDTVTISGASGDVALASRAVCNIGLSGLTKWDKKSMEVTILDAESHEIDPSLYGSLPSVVIDMSVLPKKRVPVNVSESIIGQDSLAPGYEIVGDIACDPAYVEIIGEASVLKAISSVALVPYSVSGASSDAVVLLDYDLPEGVSVLNSDKAQVTVTIREKTKTEAFTGVDIDVHNLGRGLDAKLAQDKVDVTVIAGETEMSHLRASDVIPYIDLKGKDVGTYAMDILFEMPDGFAAENFTPGIATVTVTITRG
jgi:YbbR domain-containing protein